MATGTTGTPALQLTVTPGACPWGFNTANRLPTPAERLAHDWCVMQNLSSNATLFDQLSADLQVIIDEILAFGRWVLDEIEAGLGSLLGPEIAAAVDKFKQAYDWIANEIGSLQPWLIAAGVLAIAVYFSK